MKVFLLVLLTSFISCNTIKTYQVLQRGSIARENYKETIPFEIKFGLIIIKVKIEGKTYDFILDTGAPTVISVELQQVLKLKTFSETKAMDSQGKKDNIKFVQIPTLGIQNLEFNNIGAGILDFNKSDAIKAFDVDGIIGANLMRKSIWYIDFVHNEITITNKIESIPNLPKKYDSVMFKESISGTPKIKMTYNGCTDNDVTFDTGSNGDFTSSSTIFESVKKISPQLKYAKGYGSYSAGIHGQTNNDTAYFAKIDSTKFGSIKLKNTMVSFEHKKAQTIGLSFLKNYNILIDWNTKKILLFKTNEFSNLPLKSIGFSVTCSTNNAFVSFIYSNTKAEKEGLKLNDEISKINSETLDNSFQKWYEIKKNRIKSKDNSIEYISKQNASNNIKKLELDEEIILE